MTTSHRTIQTNGIAMHVAEAGEGSLVVLCHGFPELWYSWRSQIDALAAAGYHVIAPDMRGYGQTDRPDPVDAYDIVQLSNDMLGLLDALGEEQAVFVGHDWGAPVVWHLAQAAPERVRGVAAFSLPFSPRGANDTISTLEFLFGGNFFYMLYFQEPGVADGDLNADVDDSLRRILWAWSYRADSDQSELMRPLPRATTGLREWLPQPGGLPSWLSEEDFAYYVEEFSRTGFTGGLNWYRNLRRNWELTENLADVKVTVPAMFLTGDQDPVRLFIRGNDMAEWVTDLRATIIVPEAGHWVQREQADVVNAALLNFLSSLD
jgi:pimeloyl-ACP methyl ester carboxylesterase